MKKIAGDIIIISQSYNVQFLRYRVRQTELFCYFGPFFALLPPPPNDPKNQNSEKKMNKMPGDFILLYIHVYHK